MRFSSSLLVFLAAAIHLPLQAISTGDDAWHLDYLDLLVNEELDPIVSPNAQSSHMHKVAGGSAFGASYNFDTYESASCSTAANQADKSNYWMPQLYWYDSTKAKPFIPLPAHLRFYYFLARNDPNTPVIPFPDGLRMLVGSPDAKTSSIYTTFTCQVNSDFSNSLTSTNFNFARDCPYGMKTETYFPGCWDGINLYTSDNSHMTYPSGSNRDGSCPWSHPWRTPMIMLEYTWATADYAPGVALDGHMVWASGDTTGYGVHADFVNGWDRSVFLQALNDSSCVGIGTSIAMQYCNTMAAHFDMNAMAACKPTLGTLAEPTTNTDLVPIAALPGCNPLWGANGTKPTCSPAVAGLDVSKFTGTNGALIASADQQLKYTLPTTSGWHYVSCFAKTPFLSNPTMYYDTKLTVDSCQTNCLQSGYSYAAMGNNGNSVCWCGDGILDTAATTPGACTGACPGNSSQICGAGTSSYVWSTYYAGPGTTAVADDTVSLGCYANPSTDSAGLLGKSSYHFTDYSLTQGECLLACANRNLTWAAMTDAYKCYCGTNLNSNLGTGKYVPSSNCNLACQGNSSQICGGYYYSTIMNVTASEITPAVHPTGYVGCYVDNSASRVLTGTSWTSSSNTIEQCAQGCSELGYAYAGMEYGSQCFCGKTLPTSSAYPYTSCNTPCAGNSSEYCGQANMLSIYSTAAIVTDTLAVEQAAHAAGWLGCFMDDSSTLLPSYSYTSSSMTVQLCKNACAGFGYGYSGVEAGNTCKCGNSAPATTQMPHRYCSTACKGNSTETCGATNYVDVFNTSTATASTATVYQASLGCYSDSSKGLTGYSFGDSTGMTNPLCMQSCKEIGFAYAGTEAGNTCYCGSSFGSGSVLPSTSCSTPCAGNSSQTCGGTNIINLMNATFGQAIPVTKPAGWIGCYTDQSSPRTLSGTYYSTATMSSSICRAYCGMKNYTYAGLESSQQCYCGNTITSPGTRVPYQMCTATCTGNSSETCGGSYKMDMYTTAGYSVSGSSTSSNATSSGYLGCYSDYSTINTYSYRSTFMSPDTCTRACLLRGYAYSATMGGNTCKCGNTAPSGLVGDTQCTTACLSNTGSICGGSNYMSAVQVSKSGITSGQFDVTVLNSTGYIGCYAEGTTKVLALLDYSSTSSGLSTCMGSCKSLGYTYSGMEYGSQCYCSNLLNATSGGWRVADSECNMACYAGGGTCGASNRVAAYVSSYATGSGSNLATNTVEGYTGCYLPGTFKSAASYSYTNNEVWSGLCRRTCRNKGYSAAGLMAGNQCYCSDTSKLGAVQPAALCTSACTGNSSTTCGSSTAISVYDTTGTGSLPPTTGFPANYVGCYADSSTRVMSAYSYSSSAMTSALCQRVCVAQGYNIFGTESGTQCYCSSSTSAYPATMMLDSDCSSACGGNSAETCGYSYKLSVYNTEFDSTASEDASGSVSSSVTSSATSAISTTKATSAVTSSVSTSKASSAASSSAASSSKASSSITSAATSKATSAATSAASTSKATSAVSTTKATSTTAASTSKTTSAVVSANAVKASSTTSSAAAAASSTAAGWSFLGCYTDSSSSRTLPITYGTSSSMTVEKCEAGCLAKGYKYAGLEYAQQCYCSNSMSTSLKPVAAANCYDYCSGNAQEFCGSSYHLDIYVYTAATSSSAASSSSAAAVAQVAAASSKASSTTSSSSSKAASSSTKASSSAAASSTKASSTTKASSSSTTSKASSSAAVASAAVVKASSTTTSAAYVKTSSVTTSYGTYNKMGCISESSSKRALNSTYISSNAMTYAMCASHCNGYKFFGIEYGSQCYCGNTLATNVTSTSCTKACTGDSTSICGGYWTLTYFELTPNAAAQAMFVQYGTTTAAPAVSTVYATVTVTASQKARRNDRASNRSRHSQLAAKRVTAANVARDAAANIGGFSPVERDELKERNTGDQASQQQRKRRPGGPLLSH